MITLECNGTNQTLEGWGITRCSLRLISLAADVLSFDIEVADMFADPLFAFGDQVNLYVDGVRRFTGQITTTPIIGNANSEKQTYSASGPWYILSRIIYMQSRVVYVGQNIVTLDNSRIMLYMGTSVVAHIANGIMIQRAIQFAQTRFHIRIAVGTISLNAQPPLQEARDLSCADVIQYACKWTPDAVTWFDYSVDPPTLNCDRRASLTQVTLDPKAGNLVTDLKIRDRGDLQVPGVIFNFEQTVVVNDVQKVSIESQDAGDIFAIDTIVHTFTLQGATAYVQEPPPPGIALAFYQATSVLQWEGEIQLTEQDVSFAIRPGQSINFTSNCPARFQTMNALVQECTYDLVNGITTARFGPPTQLGPQDFSAMIAASRGVNPVSTLATTNGDDGTADTPTPPAPNGNPSTPPPPGGGQPRVILQLCDDTTVCVLGASGTCGG